MADKKTELSIVLRAVDAATAKIKAINDRLDALTKPVRNFQEQLGKLREKSGLDDVLSGFKGVGSAIGDLLSKVAMVGGLAGVAAAGLFHLVGEFDDLGDKAERFGVSVDFLAQMRYAAEKAGAPVEALDSGLQSFSQSLGQARAGTGRMLAFLNKVSPALAQQLKHAKSNEAAFDLLADAMAKITDPAKRAALAQKTLGDASLAPLFAKGAKGVKELRDRYLELAGSQQGAADAAGATDDSLHDLKASSDGVKAAIVSGLAPALKVLVDRLRDWLVGHRADVKEWAAWLGERLPGAISTLVTWVQDAVRDVGNFVDAIGGWKTVAIGLAAVLAGPLVSALGTLGVALLTTPVGWFVAGIAAIAGAAYEIHKHWDGIKEFFSDLWGAIVGAFEAAWGRIKTIVDAVVDAADFVAKKVLGMGAVSDLVNQVTGPSAGVQVFQQAAANAANTSAFQQAANVARGDVGQQATRLVRGANTMTQTQAKVVVDFKNAPKGARVTTDPKSTADVDLSVGYQMWGTP